MSVKITALEAENVKRIKAVALTPSPTGLTLVGGNNNQGKTSVLDALAWALGGDRFRPDAAQRDGAIAPAHLKVTLSNGVVVERKGKNATLTVTDPTGRRSGQRRACRAENRHEHSLTFCANSGVSLPRRKRFCAGNGWDFKISVDFLKNRVKRITDPLAEL